MAIVLPNFSGRRLSAGSALKRQAEPAIGLRFLTLQNALEPSEWLEFEYRLQRVKIEQIDHLELSVLWFTEGKGSEDIGIHLFENVTREQLASSPLDAARRIATILPCGPLSYEGRLFKIRWCVRLRLFMVDGKVISTEQPFYLGHLTLEV
ncbi:MAG: hypothetical protein KDB22_07680 [Planctomycetales bacterium]|nr:hypothetical protein [Planctomycetales bacterium]